MKKGCTRNITLHFMVSPKEQEQIRKRMTEAGTNNKSAFVRRMLIHGYLLHVDIGPLKEIVSLQRRCVNNIQQIAKHADACTAEIAELQRGYAGLWAKISELLNAFTIIITL